MNLNHLISFAIDPALQLLPTKMTSPEARVMLVAIALQESRAQHRKQIGGPAHGYWQFERGGGVAGVLTHRAVAKHAAALCKRLDVEPDKQKVYTALVHQDILAAGFARLLLWTLPYPLPTDKDAGWKQYIDAWRPGKPHPSTWTTCWNRAVALVG